MVTNSDIAKAAKVSTALVSRIVNNDSTLRVSEATRARVLQVVAEMGYSPNAAARSLRSSQAGMIALVVHNVTNPVYGEIISGAQRAAAMHGKAVLLGEASGDGSGPARIQELISGNGIDGLILQGAGTKMDSTLARAAQRSVPTVLLQSGQTKHSTLLQLDDEGAGVIATNHLIAAGHTNIGFIGGVDALQFAALRRRGWRLALSKNNLQCDPATSVNAGSTFGEGADAIQTLLSTNPHLTGAVVANVVTAIGALSALHDMGYRVPLDFSLIGIQDAEIAAVFRPALTVVKMPLRTLGETAVNIVCNPADFQEQEIRITSPGLEIIERSSTGRVS